MEESEGEEDEDELEGYDGSDRPSKKGPLKITCVRNRKYIRMPNFKKKQVSVLKAWLLNHMENPYPGNSDKDVLSKESGLSRK